MEFQMKIGVSARHAHLDRHDMDILFGEGSELTMKSPISQPGQYASNEQILMVTPKGETKLRIIGPLRPHTQIELSLTDAMKAGLKAPIRQSGDIEGSAGAKLIGPKGELQLEKGIIIAARHVHICPATAEKLGLKDGQWGDIVINSDRKVTLHDALLRIGPKHADEVHIDTDEANAANIGNGATCTIIVKE